MVNAIQKEVEELLALAAEECKDDLKKFCKFYLPNFFNLEPAEFHNDLYALCQDYTKKRAVIVAPRYHAKSTIMSVAFPMWAALYAKSKRILIISATLTLAESMLRAIKKEFESNPMLIGSFGDVRSDKWAENLIILNNGTLIEAKGRGQQIRGYHYDLVICDDLEDNDLVRSELGMDVFEDWWSRELFNTIDHEARMLYVGTIVANNCMIKKLYTKMNWNKYFYQAYKDGIEKEGNELWPAKWSHEALQEKKLNNPHAFSYEFMNDPLTAGGRKFQEEWLNFYETVPENLSITVTVDPGGITTSKRADSCGISIVGTDKQGHLYSIEALSRKYDPHTLCLELFRIQRQYNPHAIGIEVVAFQKILKYYLDEKSREQKMNLRIVELKTDTRMTKGDRIMALIPVFADGKVHLRKEHYELINQIRNFPNQQHDDILDAFAYQLQIIVKPYYHNQLTPEELQKKMNEMMLKNIFSSEASTPAKSTTGYRTNYFLGER